MKVDFAEIIESIQLTKYEEAEEHTYKQHHNDTIDEVISYLKEQEPKKSVIPACVDVFLKNGTMSDKLTFLIQQKQLGVMSNLNNGLIRDWLRLINKGELLDLWNGYEVEVEEYGEVTIAIPGKLPFKTELPLAEIYKQFPVLNKK